MSDVDGLRQLQQQIAEALPTERMWLFDGPHDYPTLDERLRTAAAVLPVVTAWAERRARERAAEAVEPFRELFSGGPDTACRTTWRTEFGHSVPRTECVEIPMDDLRDAFDRAAALADDGQA